VIIHVHPSFQPLKSYTSYGKPILQKEKSKPLMFASIVSKSYVAFHLFPVYMSPDLVKSSTPRDNRNKRLVLDLCR